MPLSDFDFVGEELTEHPRRPPRRGRAARRAVRRFTLRRQWVSIVVFLLGFMVLLYPAFTQWYYSTGAKQLVVDFDAKQRELDAAAIAARMDLAHAYNDTLDPSRLTDPYTAREEAGRAEYARMLELNELLGHIEVPRIGQDLPVYAGINDAVLNKGAGHLEGTSLPVGGVDTHSVITAHRGLPNARLFTDLDKMQVGDVFFMHNIEGTLAYRVDQIITVEPSDFEPVLVKEGHDYLTLLTCTPYMINSHRLLVRGERVPFEPAAEAAEATLVNPPVPWELIVPLLGGGLLVIVVGVSLWRRRETKAGRRAA